MAEAVPEVVISGFSGRLPESSNIAEFREHLINGDDMTTEDDRRMKPGEPKILFNDYENHHIHRGPQKNLCHFDVYSVTLARTDRFP